MDLLSVLPKAKPSEKERDLLGELLSEFKEAEGEDAKALFKAAVKLATAIEVEE